MDLVERREEGFQFLLMISMDSQNKMNALTDTGCLVRIPEGKEVEKRPLYALNPFLLPLSIGSCCCESFVRDSWPILKEIQVEKLKVLQEKRQGRSDRDGAMVTSRRRG